MSTDRRHSQVVTLLLTALVLCVALWASPERARADEPGDETDLMRVAMRDATDASSMATPAPHVPPAQVTARPPTAPGVYPTWFWAAFQLIPSPEMVVASSEAELDRVAFGLRWQIVPVLFSWALREGLSPWRSLIAEPVVRHGGSVELHLTPEIIFQEQDEFWRNILLRGGVRTYLPLYHAGEYLSMSLGGSYYWLGGEHGPSAEVGVYTLFGLLGAVVTWSPLSDRAEWIATANIQVL